MLALVVDDKEENLYLLRALLGGHGYQVQTAHNGREALEQAALQRPDLVISDILMPVMDGFSLCRTWRQSAALKDVPFIFYTATYTDPKDEQLAMNLGADRFFVKPVEPDRFLTLISEVLDEHRRGQLQPRGAAMPPDSEALREYNAVLVHKLEDKLEQLEEANRALADKDRFSRAVLDAMPALVAVIRTDGTIAAVNKAWSDFASEPRPAPAPALLRLRVGANALAALESAKPEEPMGPLRDALREGVSGQRGEREVELPWGEGDGARCFVARVQRLGTQSASAVLALFDVTASKRAERVLQEAARRKDEFLALLGHELRNPLAPIAAATHMLRRLRTGDARAEQATAVIERQVGHLTRIVTNLLDAARLARGRLALERAPTDLAQVVRATAEDFRTQLDKHGIAIELRLPSSPAWVNGDQTRLTQVVGNLLKNAETFTERGGRIEVSLSADEPGRLTNLVVRDTGIGMTAQTLARLFQPFEQAPQTSARSRGGLGMGLALVKGIVEMHGGQVSASSAGPGKGSEFHVTLPLSQAPGDSPSAGEARA